MVNQYGEILDGYGNQLPIEDTGKELLVELSWNNGLMKYNVAQVVYITVIGTSLPDHLWGEMEMLYRDGNYKNIKPINLLYRFRNGPLPVEGRPGLFYVPFYCRYGMTVDGELISLSTGCPLSWFVVKPNEKKKSVGGYRSCRVVRDDGGSQGVLRHRLLCLTFKPYGQEVKDLAVNHKNGIPGDDCLDNLEWCTFGENNRHAVETGLRKVRERRFGVKNLQTGEVNWYWTVAQAAAAEGLSPWVIQHRLKNASFKVFEDLKIVKHDDGTEWPEIDLATVKKHKVRLDEDIVARDVFSGKTIVFTGIDVGEKLTGVDGRTIRLHCREEYEIPVKGYNFRYLAPCIEWPNHTDRHLEIYKARPVRPRDAVIVVDIETGEETLYPFMEDVCKRFNTYQGLIYNYVERDSVFQSKYRFKIFKLRDTLCRPIVEMMG